MILFILFAGITLLEIYVMIIVGNAIGAFTTILLIIITALIGVILLRRQGWQTFNNIRKSLKNNNSVAVAVLSGLVILISAILLLVPGFITDIVGLLGLIPQFRKYFINLFLQKNVHKIFKSTGYIFINKIKNMNSNKKKQDKKYTVDGESWED